MGLVMTKYYVDVAGNYLGGFSDENPAIPQGAIEVPNPPNHASEKWLSGAGAFSKELTTLKFEKNLEINLARLADNQTTFTHLGKLFACDLLSRGDIDGVNGRVATRGALPNDWVGGWKSVDNSYIAIKTVAEWNDFYDSMIAQGQANFTKSQSLKAQLSAATTAEQVAAITWESHEADIQP
ncbi:MAG: hypothetical protein CTY14_02135 [Methylotenera sp.]|nr:MAG: hypothetical protein CTY14_02135 [Methylotenera sp.]